MFRLFYVVFLGAQRSDPAGQAHDSPPVMLWPLRLLAVFSLIGGVVGVRELYGVQLGGLGGGAPLSLWEKLIEPFSHSPAASLAGLAAVVAGFLAARALYRNAVNDPLPEKLGALSVAMRNRFYFDEIYEATFIRIHDFLAAVADWLDRWIIAGLAVRGTHGTTELVGRLLRLLQNGSLQTYAFLFALGVALVLFFVIGK